MIWFALLCLFFALDELITVRHLAEYEKDLEFLLLRQQLPILERKLNQPVWRSAKAISQGISPFPFDLKHAHHP